MTDKERQEIAEWQEERDLAEQGAYFEALRQQSEASKEAVWQAAVQVGRCQMVRERADKDICPSCGCTGDSIAHLVCLERARRLGPVPF